MTDFTLSTAFKTDPKRLAFASARYLFVAKMLADMHSVVEVGAGDGVLSEIVQKSVTILQKTDLVPAGPSVCKHDFMAGRLLERHDAIYGLDVLEHVQPALEDIFLGNIARSLKLHGVCIIGMPSWESQPYASPISKAEHVNCKTEDELRKTMQRHFHCVYIFGMHDTTLTTAFGPMCQYRLALCNSPKL